MRPFNNESRNGNEKAIRRGRSVPSSDVNLAYVSAPPLSPGRNMAIVDTSRAVEDNIVNSDTRRYYLANPVGMLVDIDGNKVVSDRYPIITDQFTVYTDRANYPDTILPFAHVSRYFHIEQAGLATGDQLIEYTSDSITVVDGSGRQYPHYRIKLAPAKVLNDEAGKPQGGSWGYRVWVFIDTDLREDLQLVYHKVEIDQNNNLIHRSMNYREIINPEPFFKYTTEESEVVDPQNRNSKIYSTKPIVSKEEILGETGAPVEGYKVYVPKKAIADPRIYQTFRWRINCSFTQDVRSIMTKGKLKKIHCGVLVTDRDLVANVPTQAPYALYNLVNSRFNSGDLTFINPAKPNHSQQDQVNRDYWLVNLDKDDLSDYDLLIWAPTSTRFNYNQYAAKINAFLDVHNGTLFLDTNNHSEPTDDIITEFSPPVNPSTGAPKHTSSSSLAGVKGRASEVAWGNISDMLIDGNARLGGWSLQDGGNNDELLSMSYLQWLDHTPTYTQYMGLDTTENSTPIIETVRENNTNRNLMIVSKNRRKVISTFGLLYTCSAIVNYVTGKVQSSNLGERAASIESVQSNIDGIPVEGAMKMLYNVVLMSIKNKLLTSGEEDEFSTTWTYSTPWRSSWVIDAGDGVLDNREIERFDFSLQPKDPYAEEPDLDVVWKRKLSDRTIADLIGDILDPILEDPRTAIRVEGSVRNYSFEITNPEVTTASTIIEEEYPYAWTEAYSPTFIVPAEMGPYIFKEEEDEDGNLGRAAEYTNLTYNFKDYPEVPYTGKVTASYISTEELAKKNKVTYTTSGNMRVTTWYWLYYTVWKYPDSDEIFHERPPDLVVEVPGSGSSTDRIEDAFSRPERGFQVGILNATGNANPITGYNVSEAELPNVKEHIDLTWAESTHTEETTGIYAGSPTESGHTWVKSYDYPHFGVLQPKTVRSWQLDNYYSSDYGPSILSWPYWGFKSRLEDRSRGKDVEYVQDFLNRAVEKGYFDSHLVDVDGFYGPRTRQSVEAFQDAFQLRFIDGVVDAETWYVIGSQINRMLAEGHGEELRESVFWAAFYSKAERLHLSRISDGDPDTWIARISSSQSKADRIWDYYAITFGKRHLIEGIMVTPYLEGDTETLYIDSIEVRTGAGLTNYTPQNTQSTGLGIKLTHEEPMFLPIDPKMGDTVIIGVSQDAPYGNGRAKFLGFKSIEARISHNPIRAEEIDLGEVEEGGLLEAAQKGLLGIQSEETFREVMRGRIEGSQTTPAAINRETNNGYDSINWSRIYQWGDEKRINYMEPGWEDHSSPPSNQLLTSLLPWEWNHRYTRHSTLYKGRHQVFYVRQWFKRFGHFHGTGPYSWATGNKEDDFIEQYHYGQVGIYNAPPPTPAPSYSISIRVTPNTNPIYAGEGINASVTLTKEPTGGMTSKEITLGITGISPTVHQETLKDRVIGGSTQANASFDLNHLTPGRYRLRARGVDRANATVTLAETTVEINPLARIGGGPGNFIGPPPEDPRYSVKLAGITVDSGGGDLSIVRTIRPSQSYMVTWYLGKNNPEGSNKLATGKRSRVIIRDSNETAIRTTNHDIPRSITNSYTEAQIANGEVRRREGWFNASRFGDFDPGSYTVEVQFRDGDNNILAQSGRLGFIVASDEPTMGIPRPPTPPPNEYITIEPIPERRRRRRTRTTTMDFSFSRDVEFMSFEPYTISLPNPPEPNVTNFVSMSNVRHQTVTTNDYQTIVTGPSNNRVTFYSQAFEFNVDSGIKIGDAFPDPTKVYYSMDEYGTVNPIPETGYISKADGIKLLCNRDGSPYGFPELPTEVGENEFQRHYAKLKVDRSGSYATLNATPTHDSVKLGFYDKVRQEFIVADSGELHMTFIEYVKRGPQNVYVGVVSSHLEISEKVIPVDDDTPRIPYKWAMPIYGLYTRAGSKITLEPLPANLGIDNVWPIAIRDGSFSRYVDIRPKAAGPILGPMSGYQGSTVRAYYSIPEADSVGFSRLYGPPNVDILAEEPIILDDTKLQVRQPPILMVTHPTVKPSLADPRRPVMQLYTRPGRTAEWSAVPFSKIRDFNSSTGEIYLKDRILYNDPGLLRVDYTSSKGLFYLKRSDGQVVNLNIHSGHADQFLGETLYVYIVPHYVRDAFGEMIPDTYVMDTIRMTTDPSVFDPVSDSYNPLAIQLGIVYLTTALDVSELNLMDTRRRGGGLTDNHNITEINRLVSNAWSYWDIGSDNVSSYQKHGYVIVRLPEELKQHFDEEQVKEVIERNITTGVGFKLETLDGKDWELQ